MGEGAGRMTHPSATVRDAYHARFRACIRAGFSQSDAREQASSEAARIERERGR